MDTPNTRVITVEDDYTIAAFLAEMLAFENITVVAGYTSVDTARRSVFWGEVDAAVVDWMLDGDTGGVLLEWLITHHPHVRRVMISGAADHIPADVRDLAHDVVAKPFDTKTLVAAIRGR